MRSRTSRRGYAARIRMFISNREGYLVLSAGNRPEMAVGYSTLYGDMAGRLAVISDVPETMVYELARFINRYKEVIPQNILSKPPSAGLKRDQRDEDDLPPCTALDRILKAYIEEEKSPEQMIEAGLDPDLVTEVVTRVDRAEFKRRQAPVGLRVTSKAFGPGRRLPIAARWTY